MKGKKYICELKQTCKEAYGCLESEPHEEKPWCKKTSKCAVTGKKVKCIEVK